MPKPKVTLTVSPSKHQGDVFIAEKVTNTTTHIPGDEIKREDLNGYIAIGWTVNIIARK